QYPVEIPGVSNAQFLRLAYNSIQAARGGEELDPLEFDDLVRAKLATVAMDPSFLERNVNEGFSGGEKKRNEILQMALLEPVLALLDETDSGLDIDALRVVAGGVNALASPDKAIVLVTHYQRLLNYIVPDYVHVMEEGQIIKTGGRELALELEARGYDWVLAEYERAHAAAGGVLRIALLCPFLGTLLGEHPGVADAGWLGRLRSDALERANALSVPPPRDEEWRFTDLSPLVRMSFQPVHAAAVID